MADANVIKSDAGIHVNLIQLKSKRIAKCCRRIPLWLLTAVHRPGENEKLVVRLHN